MDINKFPINLYTHSFMEFKCKFLFHLIILLAICPLWGQNNKFINAYMEGNKTFLEIKEEHLDTPMLLVRHDIGHNQIIWSKHGDHINLIIPQIVSSAGVIIPINNSSQNKSNLIGRFPILKEKSKSDASHIDVTGLFFDSTIKWNVQILYPIIKDKSYAKDIQFLKNETIIRTVQTSQLKNYQRTDNINFSFYKLPIPMGSRAFDHRMAFSIEDTYDNINGFPIAAKANIQRWRLEKQDKTKDISEPIHPIVFYYDEKTPQKWKSFIKAGIEEWLPAFEAAGFKNAIKVRDFPLDVENFNDDSVNFSVIRWNVGNDIRGKDDAGGSTVRTIIDLRTGEILKSDIILASSLQGLSDDYFIRCAPLDERAKSYPLPEVLIGKLIQFVIAHEAGHAFGIKDANFGEYTYPIDKIRDEDWLRKMGHTPSIMSYARHNYVAQPSDSIPPDLLIQKVGPADSYQIKWGYQSFDKLSKHEILQNLEDLIRLQDETPYYRFNNDYFKYIGPGTTHNVVESNNPVKGSKLGLKNIQSVIEILSEINYYQKDNSDLNRLYNKTLNLWYLEMGHVLSLVGGYTIQYKSGSQFDEVYLPVPSETQYEAMDFLISNVFNIPEWLSSPKLKSRFEYSTDSDILLDYQLTLLSDFINPSRLKRLERIEEVTGNKELIKEMMRKIRVGLFDDKISKSSVSRKHKQELQTSYLSILVSALQTEKNYAHIQIGANNGFYNAYLKSIILSELLSIEKLMVSINGNTKDGLLKSHFQYCLNYIEPIRKGL